MADIKSLDQVSEALDHLMDTLRDLCAGIATDLDAVSRPAPADHTDDEGE